MHQFMQLCVFISPFLGRGFHILSPLALGCWSIHLRKAAYMRSCYVQTTQLARLQLTGDDSYQIAVMGVQGIRVEIVSDGPPPPPEAP